MSYPGSKGQAGTWQRIIGQMPPHSRYVEAFYGSGLIYRTKRPARENVLIDRNPKCLASLIQSETVHPLLGSAMDLLPSVYLPEDAVVYCDPPYLLSTRQGRFYYEHEMSDDDHSTLLTVLADLKCRVLVSGVPHRLYDERLAGWRCIRYRARTRGRTYTECLWCNFPEPEELHDWRFAGQNFRQRHWLANMRRRWLGKLSRLSPRRRGFLLNAIKETYGT
jgi:DNA adenine methylase